MKPCEPCAGSGFSDKVHRHVWSMEPADKICPECGGRGWVENLPPMTVRLASGYVLPATYFTRSRVS